MSGERTEIEEHAGCIWNGREVVVIYHLYGDYTEVRVDGDTVAATPRWEFGSGRASGSIELDEGDTYSVECDALWWGPVDVRIGGKTVYRGVIPAALRVLIFGVLIGGVVGYFFGKMIGGVIGSMLF